MMRVVEEQAAETNVMMWEQLLARGNRAYLVCVHRNKITKITPVKREHTCADVVRPTTSNVDNSAAIIKLFEQPFGQYFVVVCYGKIIEISEADKENEVKVQDLKVLSPLIEAENGKTPAKNKAVTKKAKSPG